MLAAHEAGDANTAPGSDRERQQDQRPAIGIMGDDDEGLGVLASADLALPGREQIEALVWRGQLPRLKLAPDRLGFREIAE